MYIIGKDDVVSLISQMIEINAKYAPEGEFMSNTALPLDFYNNAENGYRRMPGYLIRRMLCLRRLPLHSSTMEYSMALQQDNYVLVFGRIGYETYSGSLHSASAEGITELEEIKVMTACNDLIGTYLENGKIRELPSDTFVMANGEDIIKKWADGHGTDITNAGFLNSDFDEFTDFVIDYFNNNYGLRREVMDTDNIKSILRELTFGIEVEFQTDQDDWRNFNRFRNVVAEKFPRWTLKTDGSVTDGGEVNSPVYMVRNIRKASADLADMLEFLEERGCKTHRTAGIHIHVSVRQSRRNDRVWGIQTILNTLKLFLKHEDMIYRIASSGWSEHRGKHNGFDFCIPLSRMNGISKMLKKDSISELRYEEPSRYYGCNVVAWWMHNTLEFRVFNSSLNPERIMKYATVCLYLVAKAIYHAANSLEILLKKNCIIYGTMCSESQDKKLEVENRFFEELGLDKNDFGMILTSDFQ